MIQAMIDIGSSTMRLAIYEIKNKKANQVMKRKHRANLASHVKNGIMVEEGISICVKILEEYKALINGLGISHVMTFTTAALRNAVNSREAVAEIESRTGLKLRVLTGVEEAHFSFVGAISGSDRGDGAMIDIGGASTEVVLYDKKTPFLKMSLPVGALMMKSNYVSDLFPTHEESRSIISFTEKVASSLPRFPKEGTVCGVGGTFKSGLSLFRALRHKSGDQMTTDEIRAVIQRFSGDSQLSEEDSLIIMRAASDRIETIIPGLIIADRVMTRLGLSRVIYHDSGVREGILYEEIIK